MRMTRHEHKTHRWPDQDACIHCNSTTGAGDASSLALNPKRMQSHEGDVRSETHCMDAWDEADSAQAQ